MARGGASREMCSWRSQSGNRAARRSQRGNRVKSLSKVRARVTIDEVRFILIDESLVIRPFVRQPPLAATGLGVACKMDERPLWQRPGGAGTQAVKHGARVSARKLRERSHKLSKTLLMLSARTSHQFAQLAGRVCN